jgi:hypothetical protein
MESSAIVVTALRGKLKLFGVDHPGGGRGWRSSPSANQVLTRMSRTMMFWQAHRVAHALGDPDEVAAPGSVRSRHATTSPAACRHGFTPSWPRMPAATDCARIPEPLSR